MPFTTSLSDILQRSSRNFGGGRTCEFEAGCRGPAPPPGEQSEERVGGRRGRTLESVRRFLPLRVSHTAAASAEVRLNSNIHHRSSSAGFLTLGAHPRPGRDRYLPPPRPQTTPPAPDSSHLPALGRLRAAGGGSAPTPRPAPRKPIGRCVRPRAASRL